jgi:hypothetical protein
MERNYQRIEKFTATLILIVVFILLVLLGRVSAQSFYTTSNISTNYIPCANALEISYLRFQDFNGDDEFGPDDYLLNKGGNSSGGTVNATSFALFYQDPISNNWIEFYREQDASASNYGNGFYNWPSTEEYNFLDSDGHGNSRRINQGPVNGNSISTYTIKSASLQDRITTVMWYSIPQSLIDLGNVKIKAEGIWNLWGEENYQSFSYTIPVAINTPQVPSNVTVTQGTTCNNVLLQWDNPVWSCDGYNRSVYIYRNAGGVTPINYTTPIYTTSATLNANLPITYTDATVAAGVTYKYSIKFGFEQQAGISNNFVPVGANYVRPKNGSVKIDMPIASNNINLSKASFTTSGFPKVVPVAPTGLVASDSRCDSKVDLSWNWGVAAVEYFNYQRATNAGFSAGLYTSPDIDGTNRTATDAVPARGVQYYYRIIAKNNCGSGPASASETGISIANPTAPTLTSAVASPTGVTINWTNANANATEFKIERSVVGGGGVSNFKAPAGSTSYFDNATSGCVDYTYKVYAVNDCKPQGEESGTSNVVKVNPNISTTMLTISTSKGYFNNRTELSWTINTANQSFLNEYKIYRVRLGTTDTTLVTAVTVGNNVYADNTGDAGVLYTYIVRGEGLCGTALIKTNNVTAIGFRSATGIVTGHIEYNGGVALRNSKVFVQQTAGATGTSLNFVAGSYMSVPDNATLIPTNKFRFETWFKPTTYSALDHIIEKAGAYTFQHIGSNYVAKVIVSGTTYQVSVPENNFPLNQWKQVSIVYDGTSVKLFSNGLVVGSTPVTGANINAAIASTASPLVIGGSGTAFKIDELRYYAATIVDTNIFINHSRYLNNDELGLKTLLHFDEGIGSFAYDASKNTNFFNANNFAFNGAVTWSTDIPTASQLSYTGITDSLGNYSLTGVRYNGNGENFTIVPFYQTHSFTPNSRIVYIGDLSSVHNNQDFIDNSSFLVTGNLFYKGSTCPVPDAFVKIDGLNIVKNGQQVTTDAYGNFTIDVPIGNHFITVEKNAHTMENGHFPATGVFNFQAPLTGLNFVDSTKRRLVGRVVGGSIEADKTPGLNRSVNNIGKARIRLVSPVAGTPCYTAIVTTDAVTGEYALNIPPLQYRVDSVYVINNPLVINKTVLTNANQVVDLTTVNALTHVVDTLLDNLGGLVSIDSTVYHKNLNMVYRTSPIVDVTNVNNGLFTGEDTIKSGNTVLDIRPTGANGWGAFYFPVFQQLKQYNVVIHGLELYTNADNAKVDSVQLKGTVYITNGLITGTDPTPAVSMRNGIANYSFLCGEPNITKNTLFPVLSYTKDLQVVVVPENAPAITWKPNISTMPSKPNYHAYVLGKRITGTGIATQGPEKVDFILRDPPGSSSSSTWTAGTSINKTAEINIGLANETEASISGHLGVKMYTGAPVALTEIEIEAEVGAGFSAVETSVKGNILSETYTSVNSVSTRDDPNNVGAPADVFIGRSQNWLVGPTGNIELRDTAGCAVSGFCFGPIVNGKQLRESAGYAIAPKEVKTRFSYTQSEIENVVIPTLQSIREFLLTSNPLFTSQVPVSDDKFGSNNDDALWGAQRTSTTQTLYERADANGPSYTFTGTFGLVVDSVRVINTQISLWKQALARNEREKLACVNNSGGKLVDNFTLGSAIVTNSYQTDKEATVSEVYELTLGTQVFANFSALTSNNGISGETSLEITHTTTKETSLTNTKTSAFEYVLSDGNYNDVMSIDVYESPEGTGNVFVTRGGQTMCPYEDAVVCKYFNPATPLAYISSHTYNETGFATIANATAQREIPSISITPAIQYNIPGNQKAVFQLTLSNQSPLVVNNDINMAIRVGNNPNGAIVAIDGLNPAATYSIPTGVSLIKTLTVERGPIENEYDSIKIIFSSACNKDLAEVAYISVHFIPTCTPLELITPTDNWVFNNSNKNVGTITASKYNYNYGAAVSPATGALLGLNKIGIEFRPTNSSTWTEFNSFYKKPIAGQDTIPQNKIYSQYKWNIATVPDGNYELRAKSYCLDNQGQFSNVISPVFSGVMDRINPHPFGSPSPADGVLDPNDDISIQFNETLEIGALSSQNFDIRGVLNSTKIRHSESLNFDGISNYAEVSTGANLQKRNFTLELWAQRNALNASQTLISQGSDASQTMRLGFDASNNLEFKLGTASVIATLPTVNPNDWHHYAVAYDYANQTAELYVDGNIVNSGNNTMYYDYTGNGKLTFGKLGVSNNEHYNGNMHEVRLWNTKRNQIDIISQFNNSLNRNIAGLLYNWKMNEADGNIATDDIRAHNATIYGATWQVNPNGNAMAFDGVDDNIKIQAGKIPISKEMDFTLEFWFNSSQSSQATLFSNGKGDGLTTDSLNAWNIQKDASGKLHVYHNKLDFVVNNTNYFDGKWHHLALVMQRTGNLSAYVDGTLQNSVQANAFANLAGANMYLGARGYQTGFLTNYDNYFNGKIDEFRFWNTARKVEQIKRDKQHRLQGNEYGLQAYLPFESYTEVLGVPVLVASTNNYSSVDSMLITPQNGAALTTLTPTIKLQRPVQKVNFTYSVNNDKIIITPTTAPELLEGVTLDVTVKDVYDLHGNIMQSAKTWISYMNKNQVLWDDAELSFEKTVDSVITFTTKIVNTGGASKDYTIGNLPSWLQTANTMGTIAPNTTKIITFTIPAGGSIGSFNAGITLTTDFKYDEVLFINLKVKGQDPNWDINPNNYQYSMNVIGQFKIDGVIATNNESKIAAFNHGVLCGTSQLQYVPAYDRYESFLNIYDNTVTGDTITFSIYDAASGLTFVNVTPNIAFEENTVQGTVSNPITFEANSFVKLNIPVKTGWTWVSFPLQSNQLHSGNALMANVKATTNDLVKGLSAYDQYATSLGWLGNISSSPKGYLNQASYKVNVANADTIKLIGLRINPDSAIARIDVQNGWNWIGFVSTKTVDINTAMGNYNAATGDVLKSQYQFAYYDNNLGWLGSLTHLKPTLGYMLHSTASSSFTYPLSSFFGRLKATSTAPQDVTQNVYNFVPEQYAKTMSVIAKSNICETNLYNGKVYLGAFDANNQLRGFAQPIKNATTNEYNYYLTAYSNTDNELLTLSYFDGSNNAAQPSNASLLFTTDAVQGTPSNPISVLVADSAMCAFATTINEVGTITGTIKPIVKPTNSVTTINNSSTIITNSDALTINVAPNPFADVVTINFNKPVSCKVEVLDILGRTLYSAIESSKQTIKINANDSKIGMSAGIYYVQLTGNNINEQVKIVKLK